VRTLCIAVGNPLRGDDGVANRVLDLLEPIVGVAFLRAQQLVPELSEAIAHARSLLFIDVDVNPGGPYIEPVVPRELGRAPLTHAMTAAEIVALAKRIFGFDGDAFVCHVPGVDFDPGQGLSAEAEANAQRATELIGRFCSHLP
jgi:hydrogenase maturation protease